MSAAHIHLLLNHLPVIGSFLLLPLVALAAWRRRDLGAIGAAALIAVITGLGAFAADQTGDRAADQVEELAGTSEAYLHLHEGRADYALALSLATALAAGVVFAVAWRRKETPTWGIAVLTGASLVAAGAMTWTAAAGGAIRHPEVRSDRFLIPAESAIPADDDEDRR